MSTRYALRSTSSPANGSAICARPRSRADNWLANLQLPGEEYRIVKRANAADPQAEPPGRVNPARMSVITPHATPSGHPGTAAAVLVSSAPVICAGPRGARRTRPFGSAEMRVSPFTYPCTNRHAYSRCSYQSQFPRDAVPPCHSSESRADR